MESIQIFLIIDSSFKAKLNIRAKTIWFIFKFEQLAKINTN